MNLSNGKIQVSQNGGRDTGIRTTNLDDILCKIKSDYAIIITKKSIITSFSYAMAIIDKFDFISIFLVDELVNSITCYRTPIAAGHLREILGSEQLSSIPAFAEYFTKDEIDILSKLILCDVYFNFNYIVEDKCVMKLQDMIDLPDMDEMLSLFVKEVANIDVLHEELSHGVVYAYYGFRDLVYRNSDNLISENTFAQTKYIADLNKPRYSDTFTDFIDLKALEQNLWVSIRRKRKNELHRNF